MCCVLKYSIFLGECYNDADCSSTSFPTCNNHGFCGKFSFAKFEKQCNFILLILLPSNIPIFKNLFAQTNTAHCLDNEYVCDYYKNCMVKDLLCNGEDDCYYGEDEKDCGKINYLKLHILIVLRYNMVNIHTQYIKLDLKY